MKMRLYPRLAWQGIRKNGKIYFPYLAACIFVVMVFYLGMDRKNIAFVLIWENLMTAGISLGTGLLGGILFSKLGQLAMIYLLNGKVDFSFSINFHVFILTL